MRSSTLALATALTLAAPLHAQWTNRYTKVQGYNHHVYLEGYELPTLTAGPMDPAPAPDGQRLAFAARGWIWVLDLTSGVARRVTDGAAMDFRPAWSPDGERLAFVRDGGRDTWIVIRELQSGRETVIDSPAIELDPAFSPDGLILYYASAEAGDIDLWRYTPASGERARITQAPGIELAPRPHRDGRRLVHLAKRGGMDRIVLRDLETGEERTLAAERITSMTRPALSPAHDLLAYNWPTEDGYELRLLALGDPTTSLRLTRSRGLPLEPAWSADGAHVYFAEADEREVMQLKRVARAGGQVEDVPVWRWEWGQPTGMVRIVTTLEGRAGPVAARLGIMDAEGHPAIPDVGQPRFDLQHGRVFFYTEGVTDVTVPAGEVTVSAVQGLVTPQVTRHVRVAEGEVVEVQLELQPVWDSRAAGWLSGDHHFHLNYGGQYRLSPDDLFPMLAGEALDVATPLLANLHNRFEDQALFGWERAGGLPLVKFAQEVRSHFLGHLGLLGTETLHWPWIWGPGYQVYGADDRANSDVLAFARAQGGLAGYVHPFSGRDPFSPEGKTQVPVMLAADGVLGNMDWLEVSCLWSDELGTSELWYRFLNLGIPIALEAGTDVMNNFYRTMAVGTTRIYVHTGGRANWDAYWSGLRAGRSFVTTGPMIEFTVSGVRPGDVVNGTRGSGSGVRETPWRLELRTAVPVDRVEVLVNGEIVWSGDGLRQAGSRTYTGTVRLPAGGWIAARVHGGETVWPAMGSYPFAHTGPVWIGEVGSSDPAARARAAAELRDLLNVSEGRLVAAYGDGAPNIRAVFERARQRLVRAAR